MNTPEPTGSAAPHSGSPNDPAGSSSTTPMSPEQQRQALLDAERAAHAQQPRNFKEDALDDKVLHVGPDGTGPTSTGTFDPEADQAAGSGNPDAPPAAR